MIFRYKYGFVYSISLVLAELYLVMSCGCGSHTADIISAEHARTSKTAGNRIYHCGASALYALCQKNGLSLTYDQCQELLPNTTSGNNMLEFKKTLQELGYEVEAYRCDPQEIAVLETPAVILIGLPENNYEPSEGSQQGNHFFLIWPVDQKYIDVIDYPQPTFRYDRKDWAASLEKHSVRSLPILLCHFR